MSRLPGPEPRPAPSSLLQVQSRAEFFQALIERSRDAVVVADSNGIIIYQSPATLEQLGYEPPECVGRGVMEFVHPQDQNLVRNVISAALADPGGLHTMELRLRTRELGWRWVEVRATNLLSVAAVRGLVLNTTLIHERKSLELRTAAAKMDPHFLFNVLHSIAGMVREGSNAEAVEAIAQLRELTGGHLGGAEDRMVTLAEEWAWVTDYLALEKLRFGSDLVVDMQPLPQSLTSVRIPCRIIQPLVENAVKHGVRARSGRGAIRVDAEAAGDRARIWVTEEGDLGRDPVPPEGFGIGLETTRQRLHLCFGDSAVLTLHVEPGSSRSSIEVPRSADA